MKIEDPSAPSEGRHETGPEAMPGTPAQAGSVLSDIDALIAEIESAGAGSQALDSRIHFGFRVAMERCPDIGALLFREGVSWITVKQALEAQIPPFTTSLDAALEGEEITFVVHAARQRKWGAMQRTRRGEEILAWAATEPLARRLAAIKAWRARFVRAVAEMKRLAESAGKEPAAAPHNAAARDDVPKLEQPKTGVAGDTKPAENRTAAAANGKKKDWEVLF